MPESGGPTTQSGILYQNSWSALFLGRLLDPRPRSSSDSVIAVRVEAPDAVDDSVVTHTDGAKTFIQAKESMSASGSAWDGLWQDFYNQLKTLKIDCDRLILAVGNWSNDVGALREACQRARGKNSSDEWLKSLSGTQNAIIQKIINVLPTKSKEDAYRIAASTEVWVQTLEQLENELVHNFIPPSSIDVKTLFSLLRDMVGGNARVRGTFHQADLLDRLQIEHKISVRDTPEWGMDQYRTTVQTMHGTLSVPGTGVSGPIKEMFLWLPLRDRSGENLHRDFEEEDLYWRQQTIRNVVELQTFPRTEPRRAIIDASAGFGKTTLLHALTHRLSSDSVFVPAIVSLDALAESKQTIHDYLNSCLNNEYNVALDWTRLCEGGRAVLFFDGLDELTDIDRAVVTRAVALFGARFPRTAWVLTVRDGSALPQPLDAQRLDIERLDNTRVVELSKAYQACGSRISHERLSEHMWRHPDLAHLLRIPLFLALVLATVKPEDDLPRSRSDLLETYLNVIFAPERYKPIHSQPARIDDLREAAQYLACKGLESDSIGLSEQQAKQLLRSSSFGEQAGVYLEHLIRFGLLRRKGIRLQFTYPIVQEYLAACWLARESAEHIGERFRNVVRRPWAQAIQFSLEMHPDAEQIVQAQLELPDDAFHTVLRLIGRCIVNGARLSPTLKAKVGDRLADSWASESWAIMNTIGLLLVDGFVDKLPSKAESFLESGRMLHSGGAEIVSAKNDPAFTKRVLEGFLGKDLQHECWLHRWQEAVNRIAKDALSMYVERARSNETTADEIASIARLMSQLPPTELLPGAGREIATDESLPTLIRMAGFQLGERPIEARAMQLLAPILRATDSTITYWEQLIADNFFWNIDSAHNEFIGLAGIPEVQDRVLNSLAKKLFESDRLLPEQHEILRSAMEVAGGERRIKLQLLLAMTGDKVAAAEIVDKLDEVSEEVVNIWCFNANHFSEVCCIKAIAKLRQRDTIPISALSCLLTGITYKMAPSLDCGGVLDHPQKHPSYQLFIEWIDEVLERKQDLPLQEKCRALGIQKELGYVLAFKEIEALLRALWDEYCALGDEVKGFDLAQQIENCIRTMDTAMYIRCHPLLREVACSAAPNANRKALEALAQIGDIQELEWMTVKYGESEGDIRQNIFASAERLAARLGKRIVRKERNLVIEDW